MSDLFSTFADRLPSLGLFLLRVVAGTIVILRFFELQRWAPLHTSIAYVIAAGAGLLLLFGSWTVVAGVVGGVVELFLTFSHSGDPLVSMLLAAVALALALLGAGGWSVDAQRFGWKRIEIRRPERASRD